MSVGKRLPSAGRGAGVFYQRSLAAKIAVYTGVLLFFVCIGLGFLAVNYSSSAVVEEVEIALKMQAQKAAEYLESRFETHLNSSGE